jgi:hypothetical protein
MSEISWLPESMWYIIPILASITMAATQALKTKFSMNSVWTQVTSWVISIVLSVGGWYLGIAPVGEPVWVSLIALGLMTGLISNGLFDLKTIREWIEKLFSLKPKA